MSTLKNKIKWTVYLSLLVTGLLLNFYQNIYEFFLIYQLRHEHIIVTFSTTPHRINQIQPTVATILNQNIKVDAIYISVPYVFKRDNIPYNIPKWLEKNQKIKIIRGEDYGPATKLLGVLQNVPMEPETIIITVDDDISYPKNTILHLAYKAKRNPNSVIGIAGVNPNFDANGILIANKIGGFTRSDINNAKVSILQGFAGIAYRRKFFGTDIFDIINAPRECLLCDDVYLSYYLARHNIERQVLKNRFMHQNMINYDNKISLRADALHQLTPSPSDKHRICIAYLKEMYPNVVF